MKSKKIIDKYIQPIFIPKELVVCKNVTLEQLDKLYCYSEDTPLEPFDSCAAVTYRAYNRSTKKKVVVVVINTDYLDEYEKDSPSKIDTCSHEALHVAAAMLQECGTPLTDDTEEVYAYVEGWATKCIYTTMMK